MSDRSIKSDQSQKLEHIEEHDAWQEITGRLWQGALLTEGVVGGGIAEMAAGKALNADNLWIAVPSAVGAGALGAALGTKREGIKLAVAAVGVAGSLLGLGYTYSTVDKYSKNKQLGKALDAVYKHGNWETFSKQTKIAEKVLGHEGLNLGIAAISGGVGLAAGAKLAPWAMRKVSPAGAEWMYGKVRTESVGRTRSKGSIYEEMFTRDLNHFVNKISHGDVHVASTTERTKPYIFDANNKVSNILIQKDTTPSDFKKQIVVGSMADRIGRDPAALEAARLGAQKANYHAPKLGDMELSALEGKPFAESEIAQVRISQATQRYAIEGAEAYYKGKTGNDYSQYLQKTNGEWSSKRRAEADSLVKSIPVDKIDDGYTHRIASEQLASLGIRANEFTRAAAANQFIHAMDQSKQFEAIRAVSYYLQGHPLEYGLPSSQRISALNQVSLELTPTQIEVITNRVKDPIFDPGNFPHHLFERPVMRLVESLVINGKVSDATKAHKLLSELAPQSNRPVYLESAKQLISSAKDAGMPEEELLRQSVIKAAAVALKELHSTKKQNLVDELGIALKLLGSETRHIHAEAILNMRGNGWKQNELTAEAVREFLSGARYYKR